MKGSNLDSILVNNTSLMAPSQDLKELLFFLFDETIALVEKVQKWG